MSSWQDSTRGFRGDVTDFPLTSVLQILEIGKKTGFLYLRDFPKVAFLVFRDGSVVQAVSSMRRAGLGELLIEHGHIRKEHLDLALQTQKLSKQKKMLGIIFEELGHVTHADIVNVLTNQIREIVIWAIRWQTGEFIFYPDDRARSSARSEEDEIMLPVGVVVDEVLREALKYEDRRKHARVPVSLKVTMNVGSGAKTFYTRDASGGGLFVLSDMVPSVGSEVSLELWLPTFVNPTPVIGKVVRIEGVQGTSDYGFALQFTSVEPDARQLLEQVGGAFKNLLM